MKNQAEIKFNRIILNYILSFLKLYLFNPAKLLYYIEIFLYQFRAWSKRKQNIKEGISAPPIMIFSITNRCNLKCAGCYNHAQKRDIKDALSLKRISGLFDEAWDIGTAIIMLAGGEPFMRMDILKVASLYPQIAFPVFTNGTILNTKINFLKNNPHIFPILSLEGDRFMTDGRRGDGLFDKTIESAALLKKEKITFGFSITVTNKNTEFVISDEYIKEILAYDAKIIFFVEYVPQNVNETALCLNDLQKKNLKKACRTYEEKHSALFAALPGDEEAFGGCLAAGRGFIHISAGGDVEPCPFAPYSTVNINNTSLKEALSSGFISEIRDSHELLTEAKGGCTLWENKEWVENLRLKNLNLVVEQNR